MPRGCAVLVTSGRLKTGCCCLALENGAELRRPRQNLSAMPHAPVRCKPILNDNGLNIIDDRGDISCFAPEDFSLKARVVSFAGKHHLGCSNHERPAGGGLARGGHVRHIGAKGLLEITYKNDEAVGGHVTSTGEVRELTLTERYAEPTACLAFHWLTAARPSSFRRQLQPSRAGRLKLRARLRIARWRGFSLFSVRHLRRHEAMCR